MASFSAPWPNPNSRVLANIDFGVPLVEVFKWLEVRDTFLGQNGKKQDITAALALARDCKHPDAVWFTSIFEGNDSSTKEEARKVFLLFQDDARALCFAWCLTAARWENLSRLRRAAGMGNAFACSTLCRQTGGDEGLVCFAAAQHERDGYYLLGQNLCYGERDYALAKENYLIAGELGHAGAAEQYGRLLNKSGTDCWIWLSRGALHGSYVTFIWSLSEQVDQLIFGSGNPTIVFMIGRALKGNIDMEKKLFFGFRCDFDRNVVQANQAVSFYDSQIRSARLAVDTWTLICTRLRLMKDMRVFIGNMIWEARFEANYKVSARTLRAWERSRKRNRK